MFERFSYPEIEETHGFTDGFTAVPRHSLRRSQIAPAERGLQLSPGRVPELGSELHHVGQPQRDATSGRR